MLHCPFHRLAWVALLPAAVAGCSGITRTSGYSAWRVTEPPQRSLDSPPANILPEHAAPSTTAQGQRKRRNPLNPAWAKAARVGPGIHDSPEARWSRTVGTGMGSRGGEADTVPLTLAVDAPSTASLGEPIAYSITFANRGATPLQDVALECEFAAGLEFPGSPEGKVRRPLGTLAAGATQTIALSLTPRSAGQHCALFRLSATGQPGGTGHLPAGRYAAGGVADRRT